MDEFVGSLLVCAIYLVLAVCYLIPSFIAFRRRHPNRWLILAVNIAFGGTGFGWLGSLIWALHAVHKPDTKGHSHGGESGLNLFVNDTKRLVLVNDAQGAMSQSPSGPAWAVAQLERIQRLRQRGHLSEAEFQSLKAAVLQRA